jgi:glycosyltransferase involved in cell wall biosynthesis
LVKYEGYVEDARLQELYSNAFGLVFPSHYEGFGLPIVEAMSQACPAMNNSERESPPKDSRKGTQRTQRICDGIVSGGL